jgi:hypothetical protein
MTRKTGVILIAALALCVVALGFFLCTRCEPEGDVPASVPSVETLMIGEGVE